jgi:hypothetical protein
LMTLWPIAPLASQRSTANAAIDDRFTSNLTTQLSGRPEAPDRRRECAIAPALAPQLIACNGPLQRKLAPSHLCANGNPDVADSCSCRLSR